MARAHYFEWLYSFLVPKKYQPGHNLVTQLLVMYMLYKQWRSQGWAWTGTCPPKCLLCHVPEIEKDRDTLIEQSNILIKQSAGQVVPCQLTESGYATVYKNTLGVKKARPSRKHHLRCDIR